MVARNSGFQTDWTYQFIHGQTFSVLINHLSRFWNGVKTEFRQ